MCSLCIGMAVGVDRRDVYRTWGSTRPICAEGSVHGAAAGGQLRLPDQNYNKSVLCCS
jgi:hypothetical protein